MKRQVNKMIEYGKGKYEIDYGPYANNSKLHQQFLEDSKKQPYRIIETEDYYDPEGLNIPSESNCRFAGTKEECESHVFTCNNCAYGEWHRFTTEREEKKIKLLYPCTFCDDCSNYSKWTDTFAENKPKSQTLKNVDYMLDSMFDIKAEDLKNELARNQKLSEEIKAARIKVRDSLKYFPEPANDNELLFNYQRRWFFGDESAWGDLIRTAYVVCMKLISRYLRENKRHGIYWDSITKKEKAAQAA